MFTVKEGDEDFIDLYTDEKDGCAQVFFVREESYRQRALYD